MSLIEDIIESGFRIRVEQISNHCEQCSEIDTIAIYMYRSNGNEGLNQHVGDFNYR